jgi:hypothetical protein
MEENYVRTDEEIAHQRAYEAKEAANHGSITIHYEIIEGKPPPDPVVNKVGWRVVRHIGKVIERTSQWFFRRVEAVAYAEEHLRKDRLAAKRLGVHAHLTMDR